MRRRYAWIDRKLVPIERDEPFAFEPIPFHESGYLLSEYLKQIDSFILAGGLPWVYAKPVTPVTRLTVTAPEPLT